jgi:hypothetical protein
VTTPVPPEKATAPASVAPVAATEAPRQLPEQAGVADALTVQPGPPAPKGPPPIPTGFPEPASEGAPVQAGGVTVTETGTPVFPQPMPPAKPGHVNLATVPPMGSLTVPPLEAGGETTVIDVYGTEVDEATAERAHAAARAAGLNLREL